MEETWRHKTIKLIQNSSKDEYFYDYNLDLSRKSDLDTMLLYKFTVLRIIKFKLLILGIKNILW